MFPLVVNVKQLFKQAHILSHVPIFPDKYHAFHVSAEDFAFTDIKLTEIMFPAWDDLVKIIKRASYVFVLQENDRHGIHPEWSYGASPLCYS